MGTHVPAAADGPLPDRATEAARTNYGTPPRKCTSGSRARSTTKRGDTRAAKQRSGPHLRGSGVRPHVLSGVSRRKIRSGSPAGSTCMGSPTETPSTSATPLDSAQSHLGTVRRAFGPLRVLLLGSWLAASVVLGLECLSPPQRGN
jgi:hypothetical protein